MRINEIKVNSYGKLKNKDISLKDGINVIYGENEKGKSTLLNFIVNMFYGTSKTKKGKIMSDYDRYKPWEVEEFSGKMKYNLSDGKSFEVYREFSKKNPKIYNEELEDISKNFSIDKTSGSNFFVEQTGVNEEAFTSTVVSFQNDVEVSSQTQNILLQKIANTSSTGEDNISYKKALTKLNKKQLDEIGTARSQGKPINIVKNEIDKLTSENEELRRYEDFKYDIEEKKYDIENQVKNLNSKYEYANKLNRINQDKESKDEKLKYNENKIDEIESQIQSLMAKKEERTNQRRVGTHSKEEEKKSKNIWLILSAVLFVISIIVMIYVNKFVSIATFAVSIVLLIVHFLDRNKTKNINQKTKAKNQEYEEVNNKIERSIFEINAQIDVLEKNKQKLVVETEDIKNKTLKDLDEAKLALKKEYENKITSDELIRLANLNNLYYELQNIQNDNNEKNVELHRLKLDKENILPKLEKFAENNEKLAYNEEMLEKLNKRNDAIELVKQLLENAYKKMKSDVTPMFTKNLSNNISYITKGKYKNVVINEENGLMVELENGEYKSAECLSIGTIQQLYLSFRLSIVNSLSEESLPIMLDETFAFFDDIRLKESLININENYANEHQILLFTCTRREQSLLEQLGISYNLVEL